MVVGFIACAAAAVALKNSTPKLTLDPAALAKIDLPMGGAKIQSVSVVTTVGNQPVPVYVSGQQIWPSKKVRVHTPLSIQVVLKRPGWNAWLTG